MSIYDAVRDGLEKATKLSLTHIGYPSTKVIFSHESGLEPKNTYCCIHILDIDQVGRTQEATFLNNDDDTLVFTAFYNVQTQLSFIGASASAVGYDFVHNAKNNRKVIEEYQRTGLAITMRSTGRKQPQPRETKFVDALNTDLSFSFSVQTKQTMDWIEFITVNGIQYRVYNDE